MILLANAVKIILIIKLWEDWTIEHPTQQLPLASAYGKFIVISPSVLNWQS